MPMASLPACSPSAAYCTKRCRNLPINSTRSRLTSRPTVPAAKRQRSLHILADAIGCEFDAFLYGGMAVENKLDDPVRRFVGKIQFRQFLHTRYKCQCIARYIEGV